MENIETTPKRNIPRDLFLHLLAIVTLYWSSITFVTLLWQYINYYFPDVLNYYPGAFNEPMRFAIASLIIVFPVFILDSFYLNKIYRKEAQVRESKIRKWLIYLTLFITSLIIIGDLVSVINTFLAGEIKARFILKALSILLVAIVIFWYYLDDVRHDTPTKLAKYFASVTSIIILIAVVGAFFIVGSPVTARLIQFDQQKVSDLQNIQYQVVNYWQRKEVLPNSLSDLNDKISGYVVPVDQQTNANYEYNIKDATNLSFELCATFNRQTPSDNSRQVQYVVDPSVWPPKGSLLSSWYHETGRVCFYRIIDKQLYPPLNVTNPSVK
ncbi:MAG: DUF5671 domain-containing protein [Candidatus Staskawiczbacteria bacterium]|nr:DUF5671 domain-containing protein [Candidatus Staskawiczbacteria bacterium]